jgi:hypothetical protein
MIISLSKEYGSVKVQLMWYLFWYFKKDNINIARLLNTQFIRTSLPPYDISLPFQQFNFFKLIFNYFLISIAYFLVVHWNS